MFCLQILFSLKFKKMSNTARVSPLTLGPPSQAPFPSQVPAPNTRGSTRLWVTTHYPGPKVTRNKHVFRLQPRCDHSGGRGVPCGPREDGTSRTPGFPLCVSLAQSPTPVSWYTRSGPAQNDNRRLCSLPGEATVPPRVPHSPQRRLPAPLTPHQQRHAEVVRQSRSIQDKLTFVGPAADATRWHRRPPQGPCRPGFETAARAGTWSGRRGPGVHVQAGHRPHDPWGPPAELPVSSQENLNGGSFLPRPSPPPPPAHGPFCQESSVCSFLPLRSLPQRETTPR